jgi:hypothetical protein
LGKTTLSDIVAELGSPDDIVSSHTGPVFRYRFTDAKRFRFVPTWPLPFLIPTLQLVPDELYSVKLTAGGAGTNEFRVFFNSNWTVRVYAFAEHAGASRYFALPFDDGR